MIQSVWATIYNIIWQFYIIIMYVLVFGFSLNLLNIHPRVSTGLVYISYLVLYKVSLLNPWGIPSHKERTRVSYSLFYTINHQQTNSVILYLSLLLCLLLLFHPTQLNLSSQLNSFLSHSITNPYNRLI